MSADDEISAEELAELNEAIKEVNLNKNEVMSIIEGDNTEIEIIDLEKRISENASTLTTEEQRFLIEASIRMMMIDNYLAQEECTALLKLTELLHVSPALLLARVAYAAATSEDIIIDVESLIE
jgi:uncharacterized tellurite resistance protein B-like protein